MGQRVRHCHVWFPLGVGDSAIPDSVSPGAAPSVGFNFDCLSEAAFVRAEVKLVQRPSLMTARKNFAWQFRPSAVSTECSLKNDGHVRLLSPQPNAWEPRENRGRLRHCYGLQTPTATGSALAGPGRRERGRRPEVRISVWLRSSWSRRCGTNFSVQEKDEASS